MISSTNRTNDPFIFAAGPLTKFSRHYRADSWYVTVMYWLRSHNLIDPFRSHANFNSKEVGKKVHTPGHWVLLVPLPWSLGPPRASSLVTRSSSCLFPGHWVLLMPLPWSLGPPHASSLVTRSSSCLFPGH